MKKEKALENLVLDGISVSSGIAIGKPFFIIEKKKVIPKEVLSDPQVDEEIDRYRGALERSRRDIEHLQNRYKSDGSSVVVEILDAHLEILHDPIITEIVERNIRKQQKNTEMVLDEIINKYEKGFKGQNDEVLMERMKDVKDVSRRILKNLGRVKDKYFNRFIPEINSVIIADDLIPSDALEFKNKDVVGFITQKGGYASHIGIIARAKGVPYITKMDIKKLKSLDIDTLIIDGVNGKVIVNPDEEKKAMYYKLQEQNRRYLREIKSLASKTKDNIDINLYSNIDSESDLPELLDISSAGIGLFRSEYLFLKQKDALTEEKQFLVYKKLLEKLNGKPVVIRLFDIGGDKDFWNLSSIETNPLLGCRAIRYLSKNEKLLDSQLRALLRAGIFGNLKILIPFVSDISEYYFIKDRVEKTKSRLLKEGIQIAEDVEIGCMIEVPSAAVMADLFAEKVDFLSIGTNDLMQYIMAVDRLNPDTACLYDFAHPSLFKCIHLVIEAAKKHNKVLSLCGEMASDPGFIKILIGMGIRNFSVGVRNLGIIKQVIRKVDIKKAEETAQKILAVKDTAEFKQLILNENKLK